MTMSGHAPPSAVVGATIGTTVLAALAAAFRLFTRIVIVKREGVDDICIVVALVLTITLTITMNEQVKYGMGRHASTLTENDERQSLIWFWASVWVYYLALCFTKLSILLQYLRVFPHNAFRIACYVLMGVVIVYSCATFFSAVFACTPVPYFWDKSIEGTCIDRTAVWFTNSSINIATDMATAILPLPVLKSLQLPRRQKIILMLVFALGGFTCIISILRIQALYAVSHTTDISWNNPLAAIWSSTEVNVGILCSCIPTLKGCIARFFPNLFSSNHTSEFNSNRYPLGNTTLRRMQLGRISHDDGSHGLAAELAGREKPASTNYVSAGAANHVSPSQAVLLHDASVKDIQVDTTIEQDVERRDDEATLYESGSMTGLLPPPATYHRLSRA